MNGFKEKVVREIIKLGKKNRRLRMPALAVVALFLVIYHSVRNFFLEFRYHPVRQRILVGILVLSLLAGQIESIYVLANSEAETTEAVEDTGDGGLCVDEECEPARNTIMVTSGDNERITEPLITGWHFAEDDIFPKGELFYDEGIYRLVLAGGDDEVQIPFKDITSLLPEDVTVELTYDTENGETEPQETVLSITGWDCAEYVEDEEGKLPYSGEFLLTAQLGAEEEEREEYAFSDGVEPVSVKLVFDAPMMAAAVTATPGVISSNQEWGAQTLAAGTYTINPGVTVTVTGRLEVNGSVTINGGGRLVRGSSYKGISSSGSASQSCILYVSGGTLNLENVTVDGNNVEAYGAAVYIASGTVNMKTGAVIQNNINVNTGGTGTNAAGGIYCGGTLNIDGGTIRNCRTSKKVESDKYANAGGGIYLKKTCNMTAGSITGNEASYGGGIYLASSGATLNLSGGEILGNSAVGDGNGIYYSTLNAATSKLYISGNTNVKDTIYLDNSTGSLYPYITSALRYPITLSCSSREEGRVLAGGSGYTLTGVDASKISMQGTSLYSRLDTAKKQILLSTIEEEEAMWQESAGGEWKTGKFTTALANVYNGGTIKLLTSITLTEKAEITKTVTITSNNASDPCVMTRMPSGEYGNITITGTGNLTLTNVIYDGNRDYLQGAAEASKQSLIKVGDGTSDTGARLTLGTGAVVRDGYKTGGSGLFAVYGTMTMDSGAVIENCEVTGTGGGVWVSSSGTFMMNGGTIRGCRAGSGGSAISIDGTCTLSGGSITGNTDTSDKDCAVYLRSSGSGTLTLNGISISDNTYSVYNEGKSVSVTGDSTLSGSIYTTNAITASGNAVSGLAKTYAIMLPDAPTEGMIVVSGSKDTRHYQLSNDGYGLNPKSDGSSNLVVAKKYKVSFNNNGGSGDTTAIDVICGGAYGQLPTPTRTGYTFAGWYTTAAGGSKVTAETVVTATAAHTLYAHWTANTYTVTYNKNSGTIANESNYTSYTYGTGLTLPTPTRTGYTFGGWYENSGLTGTAVTKISTTDTGNKTYYAKWTANTYTVTYNKNSGTIANESNYTSYTYGTGLTLPTPTRTGYIFGGWYESSSLTGTAVTKISTTDTGNKTYYAKWTANTYTVTYNKNGGTIANESNYTGYTYGTGLTLPTPTRTGYTFGGWYENSGLTGTAVTKISATDTGNKSYYAKWTANTYTVTYNKNGGTIANESNYTSYTYGTSLTLPTPTRTGYTFGGWYESSSLEGTAVTKISATDTGNKTYYAKWNLDSYTLTYNLDGGMVSGNGNPTDYTIESSAITLNNPTKEGYSFAGWSGTDLTGSGNTSVTIATGSTGNRTYTAHWFAADYTVTLHTNGGNGGTSLTSYAYGTGVTLPTNWTKTGYTFDGWYDNEDCTGTEVTNISNTDIGAKEYWAKWTDNIVPVIGPLGYSYEPKNFWQWLIGRESLIITVPVTEEGSGADRITYTVTLEGGLAGEETSAIANGEAKITVSADFKGTIAIVCIDKAGNTSASVTVGTGLNATGIIIEDYAPQIECKPENADMLETGEYETAPDIAVTVTDSKDNAISGGIASVSYRIGNGSVKTVDHDYTTSMVVNDSFTIPASEISAGETVISVTATDHAGNTVTTTQTIKVHIHSGTLVAATEPTCTLPGNREYYFCDCARLFSDSGCTVEITESDIEIAALGHDFGGQYQSDENGHWEVCSRCSVKDTAHKHCYDNDRDAYCNDCGYGNGNPGTDNKDNPDDEQTIPQPTPQPTPEPTEPPQSPSPTNPPEPSQPAGTPGDKPGTAPGTSDNRQSEDDKEPETPKLTEQSAGTEKEQMPEDGGEQIVPVSIDDGKIIISGRTVETGNITGTSETTTLLVAGDGAVIVTVVCEDEGYAAGVKDTAAVANALLTPEQIQSVNDGETIEIRIDVKDISESVTGQDKEVIESGLTEYQKEIQGLTLGMYVDISMFIRIGEGDWDAVTATKEPIEVAIGIPEELQEDGREFYIIRSHEGEYTLLNDMDNDLDIITISTDMFSAYAIAYRQTDTDNAQSENAKCGLCHICPTFLGICYFIWLVVIIAVILVIVLIVWRRKKEED